MNDSFRITLIVDLHRAPCADDYSHEEIIQAVRETISGMLEDEGLQQFQIESIEPIRLGKMVKSE